MLRVKQLNSSLIGIKVQISGRLNGAEIARTEWIKEGRVPLHRLSANISYNSCSALGILHDLKFLITLILRKRKFFKTIFGIIGIKVWLYNLFFIFVLVYMLF